MNGLRGLPKRRVPATALESLCEQDTLFQDDVVAVCGSHSLT
jgi:hypothetical protein